MTSEPRQWWCGERPGQSLPCQLHDPILRESDLEHDPVGGDAEMGEHRADDQRGDRDLEQCPHESMEHAGLEAPAVRSVADSVVILDHRARGRPKAAHLSTVDWSIKWKPVFRRKCDQVRTSTGPAVRPPGLLVPPPSARQERRPAPALPGAVVGRVRAVPPVPAPLRSAARSPGVSGRRPADYASRRGAAARGASAECGSARPTSEAGRPRAPPR